MSTTVAHSPVTTTVAHSPVSTTVAHSPVTTTVAHPPVSTTIHPPVTTTVAHPPVTTTVVHSPVTTTVAHSPVSTTIHPPVTTTVAHSPVTTTVAHSPVSTKIHPSRDINIKIIINNIKYSQGVSDKQLAHLIENVKFYNNPQYQYKYRNNHLGNNNLYITVLNARLDLIRHYQILLHHLEHLERDYNNSQDEETDYKIPRHSSDDSTSKSNIIQSMITLNSHIKHIEDSIHFIKGNHKYLLLHILKNLKQQYKEDTMKIFNI